MLKRTVIVTLFLSALLMGCGEDSDSIHEGHAYPRIRLLLAPADDQQADITRVLLTVSAADMETREAELEIDDRQATGSLAVPSGRNRLFTARAYSGNNAEFEGEELVELLEPGTEFLLEISLEQVRLNIRIVPSEVDVSADSTFEVEIRVSNVEGLFGYAFELEYNENLLRPLEQSVNVGDLLGTGDEILFLSRIGQGKVSIGATRKAGTGGVDGSGVIARVNFQTISPGQAEIRIAQNENFAFHKEDGTSVDGFESIATSSVRVIIR